MLTQAGYPGRGQFSMQYSRCIELQGTESIDHPNAADHWNVPLDVLLSALPTTARVVVLLVVQLLQVVFAAKPAGALG